MVSQTGLGLDRDFNLNRRVRVGGTIDFKFVPSESDLCLIIFGWEQLLPVMRFSGVLDSARGAREPNREPEQGPGPLSASYDGVVWDSAVSGQP